MTGRAETKRSKNSGLTGARGSECFAHTDPAGGSAWQPLDDHLEGVARIASTHADSFAAGDWGHLAGLWHDLGKYSQAFQEYLRRAATPDAHVADGLPRTDHSTAGAQHAVASFGPLGHLLAYVIAGHHSGLLDAVSAGACLEARLRKQVESWHAAPSELLEHECPTLPHHQRDAFARRDGFAASFFVRMLFSALVDADFLDTEAFMAPERAAARTDWPEDIVEQMLDCLERHVNDFGTPSNDVDRRRAEVADACRAAAHRSPGFFSLTVPTGGGKTLSSMLFALKHAKSHGLERIVYVAPFTSIIEQNADEFRKALAPVREAGLPDPVIEHHSSVDPDTESTWSRLAAETWDAPLVVTTAVQFYESLFASRTSRCRKLHRLAKSVIILDEAQAIPLDYLEPCLRALEVLAGAYGATIVLCTATQPAVHRRDDFPIGLDVPASSEIMPDPEGLFEALRRVDVRFAGDLADGDLVDRLQKYEQVLCIVNTRRHARLVADLLGEEPGHFHLSALMCPAHRSQVLATVKQRLREGERCRVVSTQLIEAGVDIDFPAVYRSLAGLDSIAQAAGRCNRNGTRARGVTTVFQSEHSSSERFLKDAVSSARQILELHDDLLGLKAVEHYFRLHYWEQKGRWDRKDILGRFQLEGKADLPFLFDFRSAARDFRLIEETGRSVFIPWREEGESLCDELRRAWPFPGATLLRRLQRYTVQIRERTWRTHGRQAFEVVHEQYPILAFPDVHYSSRTGLDLDSDLDEELVV